MAKGIVTDIHRFSLHDGPGIRTTVFLKGCNMRCGWCHNPENIDRNIQIEYFKDKCIQCGNCFNVCNNNVHQINYNQHIIKYDMCKKCGKCIEKCYTEALVMIGRKMTVKDVYSEIKQDINYYNQSGGGVTISGGEVFLQEKFTYKLLNLCKSQGIHTAVESNLAVKWEIIEPVLSVIDLVMFDIKIYNNQLHKKWTGISNNIILENTRKLSQKNIDIIIRTPIITGINDQEQQIKNIVNYIKDFENLLYYELLPYNPFGEDKYKRLGMKCSTEGTKIPSEDKMQRLAREANVANLTIRY